jgi:hypothetical protein
MIVLSRFKIVAAHSCLLFAQFKTVLIRSYADCVRSQNHFAFPVTMACDADDEVFREGPSIAVATRN